MISRRTLITIPAAGLLPAGWASAQQYPNPGKVIRIVVPVAAGTSTDGSARFLSTALSKVIGGSVIVENKVGGDGVIATDFVAKAAPDGYTLLSTFSVHYMRQWMMKVPFDAVRDFEPVTQYAMSALVLVTAADSPLKSVRDVIDAAKKNPGQLTYASGVATSTLAGAMMENMAGIKLRMIPYKSSPQSVVDTAAGIVDMVFCGLSAALPLIRSGRVRALGVTTKKRSIILPDVPSIAEGGLPNYDFFTPNWIFAPRGTPPAIVNTLSEALMSIIVSPEFKQFALLQGFEAETQSAEVLRARAPAELEKWGRLVTQAGLKEN